MVRYSSHPKLGSFVIIAIGIMLLGMAMAVVFGSDGWQERWCEYNVGIGSGHTGGEETVLAGPTQDCIDIDSGVFLRKIHPHSFVPYSKSSRGLVVDIASVRRKLDNNFILRFRQGVHHTREPVSQTKFKSAS